MKATRDIDKAVPSVRPSVTLQYHIKMSRHVIKILSLPDNPVILVFSPAITVTQFGRNHPDAMKHARRVSFSGFLITYTVCPASIAWYY